VTPGDKVTERTQRDRTLREAHKGPNDVQQKRKSGKNNKTKEPTSHIDRADER
jgi:hypothetical protein